MLKEKYLDQIKKIVQRHLKKDVRIFIFGSSIIKENFLDVDIGLIDGKISDRELYRIINDLEESLLPYECDVINFNQVDKKFRNSVLNDKILWLT